MGGYAAPAPRRLALRRRLAPERGALLALMLLLAGNALFTPNFASVANAANMALQMATTLLAATGLTLVIASGGIDLSVGSVMALAAATASMLLGHGAPLAVVAGLLAGVLAGAVNGVMVARFHIQPIVVTLSVLIAGRGLAQIVSNNGQLVTISNAAFEEIGRGRLGGVPVPVLVVAAVVLCAWLTMRETVFGRYVAAVGGSAAAARMAGVPVSRTRMTVYVASGVLAALAGLIEAARLGACDASTIGLNMELDAIAAAVIGGTPLSGGRADILGTVVGALIMQVVTTSLNMHLVPYAWSLVLKAAIILLAICLQRPRRV